MDAAAKEAVAQCYVEILAKQGVRSPRAPVAQRETNELSTALHSEAESND